MATKDKVQKFARNVWLAGLGAYGKGAETVTDKLDRAYEDSNQLFNELVSKGSEIQTSLEAKLKAQTRFESKVDEVRDKLGLNQTVSEQQIEQLTVKVEALTDIVTQLAARKLAEQTKDADSTLAVSTNDTATKASRARKPKSSTVVQNTDLAKNTA